MNQPAQSLPHSSAGEELRSKFFSPAARARREAASRLSAAERDDAFRKAARGWAEKLAPDAEEVEIQRHVSQLFACCHGAKQAEAA